MDNKTTRTRHEMHPRRQFLAAVGVSATGLLAGCASTLSDESRLQDVTATEIHDWQALADEVYDPFARFDYPEKVPTSGFGMASVAGGQLLTFRTHERIETGALYILFLSTDGLERVLEWDTPIGEEEEVTIGDPDLDTDNPNLPVDQSDIDYEMDLDSINSYKWVWSDGSDAYLVYYAGP